MLSFEITFAWEQDGCKSLAYLLFSSDSVNIILLLSAIDGAGAKSKLRLIFPVSCIFFLYTEKKKKGTLPGSVLLSIMLILSCPLYWVEFSSIDAEPFPPVF